MTLSAIGKLQKPKSKWLTNVLAILGFVAFLVAIFGVTYVWRQPGLFGEDRYPVLLTTQTKVVPSALERIPPKKYEGKWIETNGGAKPPEKFKDAHAAYLKAMPLIVAWGGVTDRLITGRAHLEEARALRPDYPPIYAGYAMLALRSTYVNGNKHLPGGIASAQMHLNEGLKLDPRFAILHGVQGEIYKAQQRWDKVELIAKTLRTLETDGMRNKGHELGVNAALALKRPDQALKRAEAWIKSKGADQAFIYELKADVHVAKKDYKQAEASYRRAIQKNNGSAWLHHNFALFLQARKRYPEAIAEEKQAIKLMDFPLAHKCLGDMYADLGDQYKAQKKIAAARRNYLLALSEDPEHEWAARGIAGILAAEANASQDRKKLALAIKHYETYLSKQPDDQDMVKYVDELKAIAARAH